MSTGIREKRTWMCRIGETRNVKHGADLPMREIVSAGYFALTGEEPDFIFSGWGDELPEEYRAVHEDREPDHEKIMAEMCEIADVAEDAVTSELREELKRAKSVAVKYAEMWIRICTLQDKGNIASVQTAADVLKEWG
jgi:hypothetical protein